MHLNLEYRSILWYTAQVGRINCVNYEHYSFLNQLSYKLVISLDFMMNLLSLSSNHKLNDVLFIFKTRYGQIICSEIFEAIGCLVLSL